MGQKQHFKELINMHLNVGKAWSIKESFEHFWDYNSEAWAHKFFNRWFFWATHSKLEPIIKIQAIKTSARGFRSFKNFRYAILFHCGGLELNP